MRAPGDLHHVVRIDVDEKSNAPEKFPGVRLVKEAVDKNLKHPKLVLKSDLVPTSPDKYSKMGLKNSWVCIADYPSSDEIQENVNKVLKLQGSPLRAKFGLRWKLSE